LKEFRAGSTGQVFLFSLFIPHCSSYLSQKLPRKRIV
jgi:hypothetical protein